MAKTPIDWYYHRKSWTSCVRADSFLSRRGITVRETVDARKQRFEAKDLARLMKGAKGVLVAKGKKSERFKAPASPADWKAVAAVAIGPTGNLRAPALRRGAHWVVGFGEDAWTAEFGA